MQTLKEKILDYKQQNPSAGYKTIAEILSCDCSTVRYHLNNNYRGRHNNKRLDRRREKKKILVQEAGGKCSKCGYNKSVWALQFHHLDPSVKDDQVSRITDMTLEQARIEAKKCILVCANCHHEIHDELFNLTNHQVSFNIRE